MKRIEAINYIIEQEGKDCLYITSTGMISREFYQIGQDLNHFPMMGSMGNTLGIGIGFALNSDKKVVVIEGDGSAIMGYANLPMYEHFNLKNLKYYVLDNSCCASTGGQATYSKEARFPLRIAVSNEKGDAPRIPYTMDYFYNKIKQWNQKNEV